MGKIKLSNKDELLFGCIYRSPNSGQDTIKEIGELLEINKTCGCSHLCIVGDFNFKEINWSTYTTNVNTPHQRSIFLEQVRDNFLTQHITKPTRFREGTTPTVLDLIFTNEEHMIENIEFLPGLGKSDHLILEFEYICFSERVFSKHVHRQNFFRGNYEAINTKLSNTSWENLCSGTIDDSWNLFADNSQD